MMVCETRDERRQTSQPREPETRGSIWSLPGGQRLPNFVEATALVLCDPSHPARLRQDDLENPEGFHSRLTAWLLRQG